MLCHDGALYALSDDVYPHSDPVGMSKALAGAPTIYKKVGLRSGWGPGKTELILPPKFDPETFLSHLEVSGGGLFHIVTSFTSCLGYQDTRSMTLSSSSQLLST
jgi:hypothetical protein